MDELDFLHDLGVDVLEDALADPEEQPDSFASAAFRGEEGEQQPRLLVALNVLLPHGDEAEHVAVQLEGRGVLPDLGGWMGTK